MHTIPHLMKRHFFSHQLYKEQETHKHTNTLATHYVTVSIICTLLNQSLINPTERRLTGPVFLGDTRGSVLLFREELASGMVLSIPPPFLTCLRERVGPLGPRFSCDDGIPAIVNAPHLQI